MLLRFTEVLLATAITVAILGSTAVAVVALGLAFTNELLYLWVTRADDAGE